MELSTELREAQDKLDEFINENGWSMKMELEKYPISFTFTNGQISMFDTSEQLPEIKFIFKSEIYYVTNMPESMRIDEKFFNKLKTLSKEVNRLYMLHWFSQKDVRFAHCWTPMFNTSKSDFVGLLSKSYRP